MAGDWIKMRPALLTHPKVNGIARALESDRDVGKALASGFGGPLREIVTRDVTRYVTVASLLVIWGAANEHTEDGVFVNTDLQDIDDMVGIPGFGQAMVDVGWAVFDEDSVSVTLPNFCEYNTSGKQRTANGAERQRRYRERKALRGDVTRDVTRDEREEKRREEDTPPTPSRGSGGGGGGAGSSSGKKHPGAGLADDARESGPVPARFVEHFPSVNEKAGWSRLQFDKLGEEVAKRRWDMAKFDAVMAKVRDAPRDARYPTPTPSEVFREIKKQAQADYHRQGGAA